MLSKEDISEGALKAAKIVHFGSVSLTADHSRTATLDAAARAKKMGAVITYDPNYRANLWKNKEEADVYKRQVENRITELEQTIKNAVIIDESELSVDNVSVGTHVTIRETGEAEAEEYDIVGRTEADAFNGKISDESPVGHALMGKAVGEKVEVLLPTGQTVEYTVLAITHSAN